MQVKFNPYLSFKDNARKAMEFYKTIFGGELYISTFKEYHASQNPSDDDKVMHAALEAENGITFMASDTPSSMEDKPEYKPGNTMSMSLSGDDESTLRGYWEKLSEGGTIIMPLEKASWGDIFGICIDKFGIQWMVDIGEQKTNS